MRAKFGSEPADATAARAGEIRGAMRGTPYESLAADFVAAGHSFKSVLRLITGAGRNLDGLRLHLMAQRRNLELPKGQA